MAARTALSILFLVLIAGCRTYSRIPSNLEETDQSPEDSLNEQSMDLPNLGPAPELLNTVWLNTPAPLRLADLRGKVVLIDMWTFG